MSCRRVTVFGGTGFLGRRIVRHLQDADFGVRIASRHPDRGRSLFSRDVSGIEPFRADVDDDGSVASAVSGAWAVVNAVSLYVEHEQRTFQSVHVEAARRVAMLARRQVWKRSCTSPESARTRGRPLLTSVAAVGERPRY